MNHFALMSRRLRQADRDHGAASTAPNPKPTAAIDAMNAIERDRRYREAMAVASHAAHEQTLAARAAAELQSRPVTSGRRFDSGKPTAAALAARSAASLPNAAATAERERIAAIWAHAFGRAAPEPSANPFARALRKAREARR